MTQPHAVLHVNSACAQLPLSLLLRLCSRLPSPLPVSSNPIPFFYIALFLQKAPTVFSATSHNTIHLKDVNQSEPTDVNNHYLGACWKNSSPSLASVLLSKNYFNFTCFSMRFFLFLVSKTDLTYKKSSFG